ncbi:MAG TPA: hypothetical protein VMB82_09855, partial [Acidimicrobiales bacterium]|nr:hypothetical protein [Acidimicrobiales bacterium]
KRFRGDDLTFRYPTCWAAVTPVEVSTFSRAIVDLSDGALHDPCHPVPDGTLCGWPLGRLGPGRLLVRWSEDGAPGWTLGEAPGSVVTVGGRPAREAVTEPGVCGVVGADETVAVAVATPGVAGNWVAMTACLRSPHRSQQAAEVGRMLASVDFTPP